MPEITYYERKWKSWPNYASLLHDKYFQNILSVPNTVQMYRLLVVDGGDGCGPEPALPKSGTAHLVAD